MSDWSVLEVGGADAAAFLQAQTMNDARALAPGTWHWNGWLTPKGRVIALFAVLHAEPGRYLLACPDMPAGELAAALRRFVFRSKLTLVADGSLVAAAGPGIDGARGNQAFVVEGAFALDFGGEGGARTLWLLAKDAPALGAADPDVAAAWRSADVAHGLPRLEAAQRGAWTPQMLSLGRLAAFSLRKGCYPGQEIVARTHYLGQAKRGLARLAGAGLAPGMAVASDGQPAGTVICVTGSDEALAVLGGDAGNALSAVLPDGTAVPLQRLPLLDGLARG
ncbi:YgfZ/GcvT domain-containing protein [Arenimonas composti]|uniref:Uncharacterized protein n=1 Tax=Arenimonas composti TR7-09 = DSM 18010 TaxID=1121013 RepID=A0A091B3Z5_9GAMM|nr:folate-binding protein YgfZ [Arenimonas composti]KFN46277.1 hypothetical protein P873_01840 [Arenimonas composti TR7-09 = DSM 18010]